MCSPAAEMQAAAVCYVFQIAVDSMNNCAAPHCRWNDSNLISVKEQVRHKHTEQNRGSSRLLQPRILLRNTFRFKKPLSVTPQKRIDPPAA
jgi:hypothetical protein